ncbi:unnamed protein product [Lupinus luteus]|uniref:Uncharacterized protein n=1 Tax=Lupinus luteus TaxID=3873 RepID=A0AAV1Y1P8_LUPLU
MNPPPECPGNPLAAPSELILTQPTEGCCQIISLMIGAATMDEFMLKNLRILNSSKELLALRLAALPERNVKLKNTQSMLLRNVLVKESALVPTKPNNIQKVYE